MPISLFINILTVTLGITTVVANVTEYLLWPGTHIGIVTVNSQNSSLGLGYKEVGILFYYFIF